MEAADFRRMVDKKLTEKEWQAHVIETATLFGWRCYHTFDSRRSADGFPDLVMVRERVVWAELKRETGKLTVAQWDWITALEAAGQEVYVWKPSDREQVAALLR